LQRRRRAPGSSLLQARRTFYRIHEALEAYRRLKGLDHNVENLDPPLLTGHAAIDAEIKKRRGSGGSDIGAATIMRKLGLVVATGRTASSATSLGSSRREVPLGR